MAIVNPVPVMPIIIVSSDFVAVIKIDLGGKSGITGDPAHMGLHNIAGHGPGGENRGVEHHAMWARTGRGNDGSLPVGGQDLAAVLNRLGNAMNSHSLEIGRNGSDLVVVK